LIHFVAACFRKNPRSRSLIRSRKKVLDWFTTPYNIYFFCAEEIDVVPVNVSGNNIKTLEALDVETQRFIDALPCPTQLPTFPQLKILLQHGSAPTIKPKISQSLFNEFLQPENSSFKSFAVNYLQPSSNDYCKGLNAFLIKILYSTWSTHNLRAELNFPVHIDIFLDLLSVVFKTETSRNNTTPTSISTKRPDYSSSPFGIPLIVGEYKLWTNYKQGVKDKDPALDNELKMTWNKWDQIYGSIPYIFAYTAIGGCQESGKPSLLFSFGVLLKADRKYHELFSWDLFQETRAAVCQCFFKLFSVYKKLGQVHNLTRKTFIPNDHPLFRETSFYDKVFYDYNIRMNDNVEVFYKKWKFNNQEIADQFELRQQTIFDRLLTRTDISNPQFIFLKARGDGQRLVTRKDETTVKASFLPIGETPVVLLSVDSLIVALLRITEAVAHLEAVNIVHNDIRWANILKLPDTERYCLCDFDDAFPLSEEVPFCPGIMHLHPDSHVEDIR
jgi:hypothetical protein